MKGSVKSQLNYADIHQSPVVKHFFHKILRLLSAVTNEGSHNPGGLKELETRLFYIMWARQHGVPSEHHLITPQSSFRVHWSSGQVQRACSMGSSFPGCVLSLHTSCSQQMWSQRYFKNPHNLP